MARPLPCAPPLWRGALCVLLLAVLSSSAALAFTFSQPPAHVPLRRLADRDDEWRRPPNVEGNYSAWAEQFDSQLEGTCNAFDLKFESNARVKENKPAKELFSTLRWHDELDTFEQVLKTEGDEMGPYIGTKAGWIAFVVIGVLFLVLVLVSFCLSFLHSCRVTCGKACCSWWPKSEARADPEKIVYKPVLSGVILGICLIAFMLSFAIVCSVKAANFNQSVYGSICDSLLTLKSYYFGSQSVVPKESMVTDWKGAYNQWEEMKALEIKVTPGNNNPIKEEVVWEYENILRPEISNATEVYMAAIDEMLEYLRQLNLVMGQIVTDLDLTATGDFPRPDNYAFPQTELYYPLEEVTTTLCSDYRVELNATANLGFEVIEMNIEKYLGDDSLLIAESMASCLNALVSLDDVSYALAGLSATVITVQEDFNAILKAAVSGLAIWAAFAFIIVVYGCVAYGLLFKAQRNDQMPSRKLVPTFCCLWSCTALFAAISFIASGSLFLVGNVGGDACNLLDTTMIEQGNWEVLPADMWNKTLHGSTDMQAVLDTCVRSDGHGDVATALGLTSSLNYLEQTLDNTSQEIRQQAKDVLQLDYKIEQTESIERLLTDTAYYIWPRRFSEEFNYLDADVAPMGFSAGTRYVMPINIDPIEDPIRVFCVVPVMGQLPDNPTANDYLQAVLNHCGNQLTVAAIGPDKLMEIITAKATLLADSTQPDVIHKWCMDALQFDPYFPVTCDADATVIDDTWPVGQDLWNHAQVAATRDSIEANSSEDEARKWFDSVYTAVHMAKVLTYRIQPKATNWPLVECPNDAPDCTLQELIPLVRDRTHGLGLNLRDNVQHTAELVDNFVEITTIGNMQELLAEGRAALANFNCQFVGTSLRQGLNEGLCQVTFPSSAMLALLGSFFFIACLILSVLFWLQWDHLRRTFKEGHFSDHKGKEHGRKMKSNEPSPLQSPRTPRPASSGSMSSMSSSSSSSS